MGDTTPELGKSMIGAVLGSYRVIAEISSGGMGTVYRAEHELLGRPAAIKLLRPHLTANLELVDRLFAEAKAATAIRHPGIVEVYDFGYTSNGQGYLVMELLDGEPLGKRIAAHERFTEVEAANVARGIASALKAAHGKGIVHRDLKPDNVFLVPDPDGPTGERVKVLDFGIAKLAGELRSRDHRTQTGALMGTPLYMAPEQARAAGAIDHRADLYSLGCILYELLVGSPPFLAEGMGEVIAMQMFTEPEPPSARAEITPEMEQLVLKLLAKEPHARYQSAGDVMTALAGLGARLSAPMRAAESRPQLRISKLGSTVLDHAPPQASPKKSSLGLVAGIVTVAIAAGVVAIVARSGRTTPPVAARPSEPAPTPPPVPAPVVEPVAPAPTPPPVEVIPAKVAKQPKRTPTKGTPDRVIEVAPKDVKNKGAVTDQNTPIDTGEAPLEVPRTAKPSQDTP